MNRDTFVVDAAVLQELGERLIGRPEIALGEFAKNSFDADATICRIEFADDQIVVSDNGSGMSQDVFRHHWMRLFTTHKIDQATSKRFGRPLTGSKGIGRLSAQFLAHEMILESTSEENSRELLRAKVDWSTASRGAKLATVQVEWEVETAAQTYPGERPSGTRITLKRLKNAWDAHAIRELGDNLWLLRSPFKRSTKPSKKIEEDIFEIQIDAPDIKEAKAAFDKTIDNVLSNWQARIQGQLKNGRLGKPAFMSVEFRPGYPKGSSQARRFTERVILPINASEAKTTPLVNDVEFQILIFKAEGKQPHGIKVVDLRRYLAEFGNVSVYDAGFRLPYYGSGGDKTGEDWLSITADQGRRLSVSGLLPERLQTRNKYMLDLPSPRRILGVVEIDTNHERLAPQRSQHTTSEWLEIQPGRDRLKNNEAFVQLRDLVRYSVDFYANRFRALALTSAEAAAKGERPAKKIDHAIDLLERHKDEIPSTVFQEVRKQLVHARTVIRSGAEASDHQAVMLAPLASAGMTAIALNHELLREKYTLNQMTTRIRHIAARHSIPELLEVADVLHKFHRRLGALQDLFTPLLSDEDREATARLRVLAVVEQSLRAMRALMPRVDFNEPLSIPTDLLFPLGSMAEWNAVLQNVLANAWNAMLDSEQAAMSFIGGSDTSGKQWLRISDTGQGLGLPLDKASKLFDPFERRLKISRDNRSIAIGGQGLGLAIIRMIAHRRSARVAFVTPETGFSTTFEISWKGAR